VARFVVRRTGTALLVLVAVSMLVFAAVRAVPGNPVTVYIADQQAQGAPVSKARIAIIERKYGMGQPFPVEYGRWIWLALQGDLGQNDTGQPVGRMIVNRLPITIEIAVLAVLLAALVGIPLGVISAMRRGKAVDHASTGGAVVAMSIPELWLAFLLITWFAIDLHWLPAGGYRSISHPAANLEHLALPVIVLASGIAARLMRQTRTSMVGSLGADYVRTARAKGLSERAVVARHAARNSLITVVTVLGLTLGTLLTGAAIAETIFGIPGFGQLMISSINQRDYPVVEGVVLVGAVAFVLVSLLVDITYSFLNPRIRVS
jgi:peptide/nickel transport system permease protein